jgi:integrase
VGTIVARPRKDKTTAYMAKIILKREGRVVHRESQTFPRRPLAVAWMSRREEELAKSGTPDAAANATLKDAIDKHIEARPGMGRTKAQVLRALQSDPLAGKRCDRVTSTDLVDLATRLSDGRQAQTVGNYMSHLQSVFAIAQDAWGMPLDEAQMTKALKACRRLGLVAKSNQRDRRPTLDEINRILAHFRDIERARPGGIPMTRLVPFAIFSTRRQEEITRLRRADYEGDRVLVRDMKHPGQKIGNDVWCDLVPEARRYISGNGELLFPYNAGSVSAAFTRACKFLEIDDLHFHDLRHEGISRLFEMGWSIPQVAKVSGHRSWQSLQRYTHMRQSGDKYEGWNPPG